MVVLDVNIIIMTPANKQGETMDVTIHGTAAEMIQDEMRAGDYQSPEDAVCDAFEALIKQKVSNSIDEGLADIEAGRSMEITPDNIKSVLAQPLDTWQK